MTPAIAGALTAREDRARKAEDAMHNANETRGPEATIAAIAEAAPAVAADHAALEAAAEAEDAAEAAVLEAAIAAARPALRAASGRITTGWRRWWPDNVTTDEAATFDERRGFRIAGVPATEDHPRANRGRYVGKALYLLADGALLLVRYSGDWSRWQGESSEWTADVRDVTLREALAAFDLDACLEGIARAILKQATGGKQARTAAILARAERLRAIAALASGK